MPRRRKPPRAGALSEFPPLKIVKKIILLQLAYYTCATILILFTTLVAGTAFSPDLILSWQSLRGDNTIGWTLGFVWLLNSLVGVIFILIFVARSKLVLDFSLTLHFIHLVLTTLYTRAFPSNWLWWGLQAASASLMTFLGVWSCQYRELKPISFGGLGGGSSNKQNGNADPSAGPSAESELGDDDLAGFSRGRGRGRNRDGGGDYEMAPLKEETDDHV